ncbi:expressed protein [Phakopsora pachyrhizi]|uniref:Expressed protein n=1 Tax=Phakopsora pachyrhizi TaxID=170000 RepID=A0AAV0BX80_PHAPC|nr:expressed protein [Phakopsora pachyrhizi]
MLSFLLFFYSHSTVLCSSVLLFFFLKKRKILIHFILYPLLFCPVILVLSLSCSNPFNPSLYCL